MNVTGFLGRNQLRGWGCLNPRLAYAEHKLMAAYRKAHPACEVCGESRKGFVDVHHAVSLWENIEQVGTNPDGRYVSLCNHKAYNHHLDLGHNGNFGNKYVRNVFSICAHMKLLREEMSVRVREAI